MSTSEKLTSELRKAGAPSWMIEKAHVGDYDDYKSRSATPINDLVRDLKRMGFSQLALRVIAGEFDGTREEAEDWFKNEGMNLL